MIESRRRSSAEFTELPSATRTATRSASRVVGGLRLLPEAFEFWQGHPDRLHDRLRFRHTVGRVGRGAAGAVIRGFGGVSQVSSGGRGAGSGGWSPAGLNQMNRDINAAALAALEINSSSRAVDLGFGGGVGLRATARRPGPARTGVERSPDMLAAAAKRFSRDTPKRAARLAEGSAAALALGDGEVDRLLTVHTLYFWRDAEAGMAELHRVTAPAGRVCVAIQPREAMEGDPLHEHGFTLYSAADLRRLLGGAGFAAVEVREGEGRLLGLAML